MDDLTLLAHMAGGGAALASQLREKGLTDLALLLQKTPEDVAKEFEVTTEMANKILKAVRAIRKVNSPKPSAKAAAPQPHPKKEERLIAAAEQAISKAIKKTPAPVGRVFRNKRYWKVVAPILGVALIGVLLRPD